MVAFNPLGEVVDWRAGEMLAGARRSDGGFLDSSQAIRSRTAQNALPFGHTTIGVLATSARLTKEETNKVAQLACNGYAYAIRPASVLDGDALFALSTGDERSDVDAIGAAGAGGGAGGIVWALKRAASV